jgi:hypothetical protein
MSTASTPQPQNEEENAKRPDRKPHWINYATFLLEVILAFLAIGTLVIYALQLNQMIRATKATGDAAYDACLSAKIARQTLIEYQSGEADTHNTASATVAQVAVTTRGESPILATAVNLSGQPTPQTTTPNVFDW